jgi:hypothetical protein
MAFHNAVSIIKMDNRNIQFVLLNVLAFSLVLSSIQPPLPYFNSVPLNQRLMPNFHGHGFSGRAVSILY